MRNLLLTIMTLVGLIALMVYASSEDIAHEAIALKTSVNLCKGKYIREDWNPKNEDSPFYHSLTAYYTGVEGEPTDVDHVVSLHDAHHSGGACWNDEEKDKFANDATNHVAALPHINRAKGALTPKGFWNKIKEKKYNVSQEKFCGYISIYRNVKETYDLSDTKDDIVFLDEMAESCKNRNLITQN